MLVYLCGEVYIDSFTGYFSGSFSLDETEEPRVISQQFLKGHPINKVSSVLKYLYTKDKREFTKEVKAWQEKGILPTKNCRNCKQRFRCVTGNIVLPPWL